APSRGRCRSPRRGSARRRRRPRSFPPDAFHPRPLLGISPPDHSSFRRSASRAAVLSDPLRTYADLYHQALECRRRLDAIVDVVQRAAEALDKRPEHFRFEHIDGITLPPARTPPFGNAAAWPTAAQIQQTVADWHATAMRLNDAWE